MNFGNFNIPLSIALVCFLVLATWAIWHAYAVNKKFEQSIFARLRNYDCNKTLFIVKYICLGLSLLLLIIAILRPQWGSKKTTIQSNGVDVIFTLDVSQSMKAQDLSDGGRVLDRLTGAKYMIKDFVQKQPGNRYGLVIFAGEAFVSTPLTFDHAAFFTFLDGVSYDDVGTQGTLLSEALKASLDRFLKQDDEDPRGKAIILISDGGEDMDEATERFAEIAKEDGIRVVTIGIGSDEGAPIPESQDFFGNVSYKQHKGEIVYTKLNEDTLREIADMTDGQYFHVEKAGDLEIITQELEQLQKSKLEQTVENMREDRYQWFLLPSFLCFIGFVFVPKRQLKVSLFKTRKVLIIFCTLLLSGCDILTRYHIDQANEKFQKQYLKEAEMLYEQAEKDEDLRHIAGNNRSIVDYTQRDFEKAKTLLQSLSEKSCKKESVQDYCDEIYYNLGNALYRFGEESQDPSIQTDQWSQAASAYEKALQINPEDKEAQDNLAFVQQKLQEAQSQQSQQGEEGQQGNSSESQQGQNGEQNESNEGNEKKEGEPSGENQEDQNGEEGEKSEAQKAAEKATEDAKYGLNEDLERQVEEYMQQMKQNESRTQQHFQRNPEAQQQDSNDPFNDPFFQQFFGGNPQQRDFKGNGSGKQLEKDW